MRQNIIINLSVEGTHCFPAAKEVFPDVAFLSNPHRHIFHICCKKAVSHLDRDIEIIRFKRSVLAYLNKTYGTSIMTDVNYRHLEFGSKSCEMICEELLEKFNLEYVSVLEDLENGSEIFKN